VKRTTAWLHIVARAALRLRSPLATKRVTYAVARVLPALTPDEARREARALADAGKGTCLSRSLCVASRLKGAEVIIGVGRGNSFEAHAWVEWNGSPILDEQTITAEVARL
jgi:hypothetical protein